jgi:hypothetical protein
MLSFSKVDEQSADVITMLIEYTNLYCSSVGQRSARSSYVLCVRDLGKRKNVRILSVHSFSAIAHIFCFD